jgi:hypothetical protein
MAKWVEGGASQEVNDELHRERAMGQGDYGACLLPDFPPQQLLSIFSGHASSCGGVRVTASVFIVNSTSADDCS